MLQTLWSLACPAFCIFPSLSLPAPSLIHLGPEDAGPTGATSAPLGPVLGLSPVSVFIPAKGACSPGLESVLCQGEVLRSFTLFCLEVIFHRPRRGHLLKV